jgi:hypothetical protein
MEPTILTMGIKEASLCSTLLTAANKLCDELKRQTKSFAHNIA